MSGQLTIQRALAIGALAVAVIAIAVVMVRGGGAYVIHARFLDASQLVKGDLVTVGGRSIGTITAIELSDENQADVELSIKKERWKPLRRGTRAEIRTVGLSGVANRFVELHPSSRGEEIEDGGVLTTAQTRPIVDLDELLNALDAPARADIQGLIRNGADIFDGNAEAANRTFRYANPAVSQTATLARELARDRAAVERLVTTGATVASALASRRTDLEEGIGTTATTLRAVASERAALQSALVRAPGALAQAGGTLRNLRSTLDGLRPALRDAQPVAQPLADLLRRLPSTSRRTRPVLAQVRALLPSLRSALDGLPALEKAALPALASTTSTVGQATPVFAGLRPYAFDLIHGLTNGFGGSTTSSYDANGHFARISINIGAHALTGLPSLVSGGTAEVAGFRAGLNARCPGGAAEPAADRSNPWIPDPSLCNPEHDHRG